MKTIIHVNQAIIAKNRKEGTSLPPIIVRTYKGSQNAQEIRVNGPVTFRYSPDKPLPCGARLWAETNHDVVIIK